MSWIYLCVCTNVQVIYVTLINEAGSGVTDALFKALPLRTLVTVFFSYSELLDLIQVLSVNVVLALPISVSLIHAHTCTRTVSAHF